MGSRNTTEVTRSRRFAVALGVILAGLALWAVYRGHAGRAGILGGLALVPPALAWLALPVWLAFFRVWMKAALVLSWISTRIILTLFFFLFFTPVSLFRRLFGRQPLDVAWKDGRESYWIDLKPEEETIEAYRRQY